MILFSIQQVPMYASLPHFYMAEELLSGIESGLNPNKTEHGIKILLETVSHNFFFLRTNFRQIFLNVLGETPTVDRNTIICGEAITIQLGSKTNSGN